MHHQQVSLCTDSARAELDRELAHAKAPANLEQVRESLLKQVRASGPPRVGVGGTPSRPGARHLHGRHRQPSRQA